MLKDPIHEALLGNFREVEDHPDEPKIPKEVIDKAVENALKSKKAHPEEVSEEEYLKRIGGIAMEGKIDAKDLIIPAVDLTKGEGVSERLREKAPLAEPVFKFDPKLYTREEMFKACRQTYIMLQESLTEDKAFSLKQWFDKKFPI